jgi:hypothetical protein
VALSEDQKAILRLLAQRGAAGYEDLAALLGTSVGDVHARAKAAAGQLESEGIPAPSIPEPSSGVGSGAGEGSGGDRLGEPPADPSPSPPPKPAERPAPTEPERQAAPAEPEKPIAALPEGERKPPLRRELKLLEGRGLWAILAGVAIVVLFVVILVVSGGGGGSDSTTTGSETTGGETTTASNGKELTQATLNPVDGSEAKGKAIFGRVKNSLALQVLATGLEQTGNGESYTIWLAASPQKMLPLASTEVKADGQIRAQVDEVPTEVLAYLANETFGQIAVTRTDDSQLKASLAKATKEKSAPVYTGTEVLRGTVTGPIVGAAQSQEGE